MNYFYFLAKERGTDRMRSSIKLIYVSVESFLMCVRFAGGKDCDHTYQKLKSSAVQYVYVPREKMSQTFIQRLVYNFRDITT